MHTAPSRRFWADKRVLVTGGHGFLGAHLCRALHALCAHVTVVNGTEVDLRDARAVRDQWDRVRPEVVLHLAARVGANRPLTPTTLHDNLLMGTNVIHQSHLSGVEALVTVGTARAYPKCTPVPFKEDDLWKESPEQIGSPLEIAERAVLMLSQTYRAEHGLNATYALAATLYGEGDPFGPPPCELIPSLLSKICCAQRKGDDAIECWGDGTATREFLHVSDAVLGILLAAEHRISPESLNLGTGVETSISDLVHLLCQLCGYRGEVVFDSASPTGQTRRCLDVSRARDRLGFEARVSLQTGLARTVAWYLFQPAVCSVA